MNYCPNCGKQMTQGDTFCSNCGRQITINQNQNNYGNDGSQNTKNGDGLNILYGFLGFFFPIVGLVLYFVFKQSNPEGSKAAGIGALIKVGFAIVVYGLMFFYLANERILG